MWKAKLEEVKKGKQKYGELANGGATEQQIEQIRMAFKIRFNQSLPVDYFEFLKEVNGIENNGFIVYGIDEELINNEVNEKIYGIMLLNEIWYENEHQKEYIFLGESNISWYVYILKENVFAMLDNPSGSLIEKYEKFNDLVETVLSDSLL